MGFSGVRKGAPNLYFSLWEGVRLESTGKHSPRGYKGRRARRDFQHEGTDGLARGGAFD
jgi:hypothetical protein